MGANDDRQFHKKSEIEKAENRNIFELFSFSPSIYRKNPPPDLSGLLVPLVRGRPGPCFAIPDGVPRRAPWSAPEYRLPEPQQQSPFLHPCTFPHCRQRLSPPPDARTTWPRLTPAAILHDVKAAPANGFLPKSFARPPHGRENEHF